MEVEWNGQMSPRQGQLVSQGSGLTVIGNKQVSIWEETENPKAKQERKLRMKQIIESWGKQK